MSNNVSLVSPLDTYSRYLIHIEDSHHQIHEGVSYVVSDQVTLGDGGTREYIITSPDSVITPHFVFRVVGSLETTLGFYEGTGKGDGTGITSRNRNRRSSNTSLTFIEHTPGGGSGDGTLIYTEKFGNDGGFFSSGAGGLTRGTSEWLLARNTKYRLLVTSGTADNNVSVVFNWYEITPVT